MKENLICLLIGHNWTFKNYLFRMQTNGNSYPYKKSRKCKRCQLKEITFDADEKQWQAFSDYDEHAKSLFI